MTKQYELEHLSPSLLILDERFQSRQTHLIKDKKEKAASEISRQQQIKTILMSLETGNGIKEPIEAYELYGELFVVSGFHRTKACHTFLKKNPEKTLNVPVKVYRGYTEAEAYMDSLTKNLEYGTALNDSEKWQNKFKQSLMQGENLEPVSKRETAKLFICSDTQGLHIRNAQLACIEAGLPTVIEWMSDYQKTVKKLRKKLQSRYEALRLEDFDKDGFPIIIRLANAYKGKSVDVDKSDEDLEQEEVTRQFHKLEELIVKNPSAFRKALNRLDKKALGLVVKRSWNEENVILKYNNDDDKDANGKRF